MTLASDRMVWDHGGTLRIGQTRKGTWTVSAFYYESKSLHGFVSRRWIKIPSFMHALDTLEKARMWLAEEVGKL